MFYTGNEAPVELFALDSILFTWAPLLHGLVVFGEHRYYGSSLPFGNQTFSEVKNWRFLSIEQVLADYAYLIEHIVTEYKAASSPVIAFGCSYGSLLSAGMRLKYPNVVAAAWVSSNFYGIMNNVSNQYVVAEQLTKIYGRCQSSIKYSWGVIFQMLQSESGRDAVSNGLRLCQRLASPADAGIVVSYVFTAYLQLAQFNYPYSVVGLPAWSVNRTCDIFQAAGSDLLLILDAVGASIAQLYNATHNLTCLNISHVTNQSQDPVLRYLMCTEMLMPIGFNGVTDMFFPAPFNVTSFAESCMKTYEVTPRLEWLNLWMAGLPNWRPDAGSNIVFSHGLLDPWAGAAVQNSLSPSLVVVEEPDTAHCLDISRPPRSTLPR